MGLAERRQPHGLSVLEPPAFLLDSEPADTREMERRDFLATVACFFLPLNLISPLAPIFVPKANSEFLEKHPLLSESQ